MEENLEVDKDYKEAFNLGYELAKELNLKLPMFKDLNSGNNRMHAMQAGMAECVKEIKQGREKGIDKSTNLDNPKHLPPNKDSKEDKSKGLDLSI